jgi:A/G-specific adenine glycosylase
VEISFAAALLAWYDQNRRPLPWRRSPDPYRTLVSEFMLQQTVVATVVPYFQRFLRRFPDLPALAGAAEEEVLAHWSGLGYYARARNLHRAARAVVDVHGGKLPAGETALRSLPGVGEYTAAAVAAIAFGARTFALDGNAARVMARLHGEERSIDQPVVRASLRARGLALVPAGRPGDFAQAVMELGARLCVAATPRCHACPVRRHCRADADGRALLLPARTPRRPRKPMQITCVALERRGRILLVRRPAGVLLGGTWVLPSTERAAGEPEASVARRALAEVGLPLPRARLHAAGTVRHLFTHRDVTAHVLLAPASGALAEGSLARWVRPAAPGDLALSSFTRKTLALLDDSAAPVPTVPAVRSRR